MPSGSHAEPGGAGIAPAILSHACSRRSARLDLTLVPSALSGLTVLDLATFVAAPFCCTLLGEFGALRRDARYSGARAPDRARYVRDVRESAERFGFPWAFWCLFDGMGMMDERDRVLDPAMVSALGLNPG